MYFNKIRSYLFKCLLLLSLLFITVEARLSAQSTVNTIKAVFSQYKARTFSEKIYAHTDKNYYLSGEILWFKLYNTDATFHKPADLSKVAYVELLDSANKPVLQAKIGLKNGEGNGSLYLPVNLSSGNYLLRAYTNWMKNFDPVFFFQKKITIVNVQKSNTSSGGNESVGIDIKFFPEGGDLIYGLQNHIGFKAIAANGKSAAFTGYLLDNNDTVLQFTPLHAGMGSFDLTPQTNHTYKAVIKTPDGISTVKPLPIIYNTGYNMRVTDNGDKWSVQVQCNVTSIKELYVLAYTGDAVKYTGTASLQNGKASFEISKALLGDGISRLTAFNDQGKAVSERLVFKKPETLLSITAKTNQDAYRERQKVSVDIALNNTDTASLSMAVYRLDSLQQPDLSTIEHYLLFSSELKGYIEDPTYYFDGADKSAPKALDNLLITQGWRRFKWNEILRNEQTPIEFIPETNGHIVKGKVINMATGQPAQLIETYLSVPGSMTQFKSCISDSAGTVKYEFPNFFGGTSVVATTNTITDTINKIEIEDPFSKSYNATALPVFEKPFSYPNTILDQHISMQVQNVYTAEKQRQFYLQQYVDTTSFYVTPELKYALDDYTRFTSMEEVLREYVAMVNVTRRGGRVYLPVVNSPENVFFQTDPLVLIDGVPVFNFNKLLEFDPLKVKNLDVVTRRYIYGTSVFEGILNYKTYSPSLSNYNFAANVNVAEYEGLQLEREFYTPVYNTAEATASHLPDFRNVLQWKPDIHASSKKNATIELYTSDLPGKYVVVIQGLAANGLCGSKVLYFDVVK